MKLYTEEEYKLLSTHTRILSDFISSMNRHQSSIDQDRKCSERAKPLSGVDAIDPMRVQRHAFIPSGVRDVVATLLKAKDFCKENKVSHPSFLDCGCGNGWVVQMASIIGYSARGIEYLKENVALAKTIFGHNTNYVDSKIYHENILTYKNYDRYDVLFFYCPISDGGLEIKFERKIARDCKIGAIVATHGTGFGDDKKRFTLIQNHQYFDEDNPKNYFGYPLYCKISN